MTTTTTHNPYLNSRTYTPLHISSSHRAPAAGSPRLEPVFCSSPRPPPIAARNKSIRRAFLPCRSSCITPHTAHKPTMTGAAKAWPRGTCKGGEGRAVGREGRARSGGHDDEDDGCAMSSPFPTCVVLPTLVSTKSSSTGRFVMATSIYSSSSSNSFLELQLAIPSLIPPPSLPSLPSPPPFSQPRSWTWPRTCRPPQTAPISTSCGETGSK